MYLAAVLCPPSPPPYAPPPPLHTPPPLTLPPTGRYIWHEVSIQPSSPPPPPPPPRMSIKTLHQKYAPATRHPPPSTFPWLGVIHDTKYLYSPLPPDEWALKPFIRSTPPPFLPRTLLAATTGLRFWRTGWASRRDSAWSVHRTIPSPYSLFYCQVALELTRAQAA